jgi:hypothetical protein
MNQVRAISCGAGISPAFFFAVHGDPKECRRDAGATKSRDSLLTPGLASTGEFVC